jgi:hypothetical protein
VLFIIQLTNGSRRPELSATEEQLASGIFHTHGSAEIIRGFGQYPDVHEFARKIASAFPAVPLLGCDIVKDIHTGELHALEVNAGGDVWHFSSPFLAEIRAKHPNIEKSMKAQYGAFDVAAKALIRATRQMAV